jgi:hypothetical protein
MTCVADQVPVPRAVGMPRSFRPAAMSRNAEARPEMVELARQLRRPNRYTALARSGSRNFFETRLIM